jgi:hypothetical protein
MDFDDFQKYVERMIQEQNNQSLADFEGYSPEEMHYMNNFLFDFRCPVRLKKLSDTDYKKIPMLNQIRFLLDKINEDGEIKLTKKGFLPTKLVKEIYEQGYIKDEDVERGITKLYKETDSKIIHLTHILVNISGITKKRNDKLSLTKNGEKIVASNENLLKLILKTFATKFNWAYFDGYGENPIGQLGFGFSLILLSKYGDKRQRDSFYAEKYFTAFPSLPETVDSSFSTIKESSHSCYSLRTYDRFLDYFGLVDVDEQGNIVDSKKFITKTTLFDKLIKCDLPKNA